MSRSVELWIGKNDDTPVPPRVRLRTFDRCQGKCHMCGRKIRAGEKWTCEHLIALINGGLNAETNLGLTCANCLPTKNENDVGEKSNVYQIRAKHFGISLKPKRKWPSRPFNNKAAR